MAAAYQCSRTVQRVRLPASFDKVTIATRDRLDDGPVAEAAEGFGTTADLFPRAEMWHERILNAGHDAKVGALIQARMSSTRLPGKVLKELPFGSGVSDLAQVVRRTRRAAMVDEVVVATTDQPEDDAIVAICEAEGVRFFRGSLEDVLSRYYLAARAFGIDVVVRVTSDCPCIDPAIIDLVVTRHLQGDSDYTANVSRRTFPHGLDLEVIPFETLELMNERAGTPYEREHVCPYLERDEFRKVFIEAPPGYFGPDVRVTLDTPRDYALLCAVFDYLSTDFDGRDIVTLFQEKPWLKLINLEDAG